MTQELHYDTIQDFQILQFPKGSRDRPVELVVTEVSSEFNQHRERLGNLVRERVVHTEFSTLPVGKVPQG